MRRLLVCLLLVGLLLALVGTATAADPIVVPIDFPCEFSPEGIMQYAFVGTATGGTYGFDILRIQAACERRGVQVQVEVQLTRPSALMLMSVLEAWLAEGA